MKAWLEQASSRRAGILPAAAKSVGPIAQSVIPSVERRIFDTPVIYHGGCTVKGPVVNHPLESRGESLFFGAFRVETGAMELWRGEQRIALRGKCFDLLMVLVRNRGNLVLREALFEQVWPDVVVSEATLSRTLAELREALGDDAAAPRYIETIPRRGYKFIAAVDERSSAPDAEGFLLVHRSQEFRLRAGDQIIGRGRGVAIPLHATLISRHHARVRIEDQSITIEDLGSKNGTFVNGRQAEGAVQLRIGDEIEIGGERLVLYSSAVGASTRSRTVPPE